MRRLLIVGEAPGRSGGAPFSLEARSGRRLAELLGVERVADACEVVNLLDEWPGRSGLKGARFPTAAARARAGRLELSGRVVIVAGKRAALALGVVRPEYLVWIRHRGAALAVIPHPSGVNRWWNVQRQVRRARRFARAALRRAARG